MLHQQRTKRFFTSLAYQFGRFEMLLGLLSVGLATLFLRLQSRKGGGSPGLDSRLRLVTVMLMGAFMMLLTKRPSIKKQYPSSPKARPA